MDTVLQLFRLAYAGGAPTLAEARRLYACLILILMGAVGIVLIGWGFNLADIKWVSIFLSLLLTFLAIVFWFEPMRLAMVAVVGAVAGALPRVPGTATSVAERFLRIYVDLLGKILLWGSVLLFVLGTVPFGENPSVIFGLTAGLLLLAFIQWQWGIGGDRGKRWFYLYVCAQMMVFGLSLVPGPTWVKYMPYGWNPKNIGTTKTEETLYRLERLQQEMRDADRAEELERIAAKIAKREALTEKEQDFIARAKAQAKTSSMPTATAAKTSPVANPMVLTLGPGEKSKKIPVPYQMHVVMGGKDFRYHCVYGNGDDVSFLPGQPPCPSGDMPYVYAENLRKGDNVITYSYAK